MILPLLIIIFSTGCGHTSTGMASWYGKKGEKTASGERVNPSAMTAAHRKLPFNSIVRVTEVKTGKYVDVRITDRGPYIKGRIIDLTRGAFKKIAPLNKGVVKVKIRVLKMGPSRKRKKKTDRKHPKVIRGPFGENHPVFEDMNLIDFFSGVSSL
ncbi:MAG: septal ring lytic transglycosylase RlpA family protein [Deltaproteobacteria bacterium]|nr:septal ring lytic transglycosylase RlpA family protein [Deltaproteobacteria bacterium]